MNVADITKIKIWQIIAGSNHFWFVTLIFYLQYRGISLSQSLQMMSIYYILVVILEYPTGVIGDYFSHKTSVILGNISGLVGFAMLCLPGSFPYYILSIGIVALGIALVSGSDTALFHSISKDFKKDWAQIMPISIIVSTATITVGGFVGSVDIRYPLYLSLLFILISFPILLTIKPGKQEKDTGNVFSVAFNGVRDIFSNVNLLSLITISGVFGAFYQSIKWFYNPIFEEVNIPVAYWGVIIGAAVLLFALGSHVYRKRDSISLVVAAIIYLIAIFLVGLTVYWAIPVLGIWMLHIANGYQDTYLKVEINDKISTNRRASILSFNSLLTRLLSAGYIAVVGIALPASSFIVVMTLTAVIIGLVVFIPLRKLRQTTTIS